ncbi:Mfa1 family fimbria major subunit [uncultured Phocaeicola sp.]|uniref:Mfa1 family fimbria major subunit n=1 Tax=uncultured Phocaeicola sp. TaxID=990718 RepID=UPI0025FA61E8|nr:Mfa1 family fimbria major subunit [uncultured Phocaeicola sp.]
MKLNLSTYLPLLFLLALLVTACKDDTLPASPAEEEEAGSGVYVSVVVNTGGSNASRVPTPREDDDLSKQSGTGDENMVHDLTVFFLDDDLNNATTINASAYFSEKEITPEASGNITLYTVQKEIEGLYVGNTYHVLVIANAGDLTNEITDIEGLKNKTFNEVIVTHDTEQWFLMASEKDSGEIEIRANNSEYNPTWVTVDVERMTARVDCAWENEYEVSGDNMSSDGGNSSQDKDKVTILGAALVNHYVGNTYAFKRVTNGTDLSTVNYLGDETRENGTTGNASNYVLDPLTVPGKHNSHYTYYYMEYVNWDIKNDFANPKNNVTSEQEGRTYYCLSYARENINTTEQLSETEENERVGIQKYATGIMFKAQYTPAGFSEGETFYRYTSRNGSGLTLYTAKALMNAFPNTFTKENQSAWGDIEGCDVFLNGWCYYVYWIRHAEDNSDDISPMKYAMVRNNIYQLYVNSIRQLGTPEPDSNVEEINTEVHFQVKPWNIKNIEVPVFD